MLKIIKNKYEKYKEIINYLFFGVLTTIVNFVVYIVLSKVFHVDETISNIIAWILSVLFAYITNKKYVFSSRKNDLKSIIKEMGSFFTCRLASGIFDIVSFFVLIKEIGINDIISKALIAIVVVIMNYIFSKIIVFKKNQKHDV